MAKQEKQTVRSRSRTMEDVAQYIKSMKFKKKTFGGVDEADVWKQIEELHKEYEAVFIYQEATHALADGAKKENE